MGPEDQDLAALVELLHQHYALISPGPPDSARSGIHLGGEAWYCRAPNWGMWPDRGGILQVCLNQARLAAGPFCDREPRLTSPKASHW